LDTRIQDNPDQKLISAHYTLLDLNIFLVLSDSVQSEPNDSLLPILTLGNKTYYNIYVREVDTTYNNYTQQESVWKAYYNEQYGIVGFYDRQTQSLFYRE
jgi:hypothetical protein